MHEHSALPGHPRFYAYVSGAGTVPGAATEMATLGNTTINKGSTAANAVCTYPKDPAGLPDGDTATQV